MDESIKDAARLVVKDGLRLGLASDADRHRALAVVWAALATPGQPAVWSERQIGLALNGLLEDTAAFLDTDHAELRRWMVDTGWLVRDGYGREYRRAPLEQAPAQHADLAAALGSMDVATWSRTLREASRADRQARRQAWLADASVPSMESMGSMGSMGSAGSARRSAADGHPGGGALPDAA